MTTAYLSLGSNLGDRKGHLAAAVQALDARERVAVTKVSSVYETEPIGGVEQEAFLNIAVEVETDLSPWELLALAHEIEAAQDRRRKIRWGPRTIDIDILLYGDVVLDEKGFTIPHPEMTARAFVLVPLVEIAPDVTLPGGRRARSYLEHVSDQGIVKIGSLA